LNKKNFLLRIRHPGRLIFDLLLPVIIGLILGKWQVANFNFPDYDPNSTTDVIALFSKTLATWTTTIIYIPIFFAGPCIFLMNQLVVDKETKMREAMRIMSLNSGAYSISYWVSQFIMVAISTVILVLALWLPINNAEIPEDFLAGSVTTLIFSVLLFGSALLSVSMTISSLFTDSKLSAQVGPLVLLFPSSIAMAIIISKLAPNITLVAEGKDIVPAGEIVFGYFLPHFPFCVAMLDFYFDNGAETLLGLSTDFAYVALGINVVGYYLLYEYLDAIIPNAYGISKSCCCCLTYCKKKKVNLDEMED
jgi:ABC-type multidrug transport system fused ATPase/permease subunit